jgi:hypothetical protein
MASNIDIYLDAQGGGIQIGGSAAGGVLPQFTRNDVYTFRLRIQDAPTGQVPSDIDTTGASLKLGIGNIDDVPTDGQFRLTCNGTTSSAITFSSTALQIYTAISNNVSTVTTFGNEEYSYVLTATQPNTAMSFGGDSFTLFPLSSVLISTRRFPASNTRAQQIIKLRRNPAVYANSFVSSSTAGEAVISKIQDGSSTSNESYRVAFGKDVVGGSFVLNYGGNSTTAIAIGATAVCATEALTAVTGIGAGNISVSPLVGENGYSISFVRSLGSQNVTTNLLLDTSGIYFAPWRQATVTFATAELDELFAEAGTDTLTPTIEIEMTDGGNPKTLHQGSVTIRKDLITSGSAIPATQESYYTKAEANALFVEDSATNVDATNRSLYASDGNPTLDWNNRTFVDSTVNEVLVFSSGIKLDGNLGFYGNSPTAKPSGVNIVSGLTNLGLLSYTQPTSTNVITSLINTGLIASGATYGVLPQSPRTVTTLTSVTFGTLAGNDQHYRDVVVTGAAVNDIVLIGLPSAVSAGIVIQGVAYKDNTVCLSAIHADTGSVDLNTATYRITVIGY